MAKLYGNTHNIETEKQAMVPTHALWNSVVCSLTGLLKSLPGQGDLETKWRLLLENVNAVVTRLNTTPLLISAFEMLMLNPPFFKN